MIKFILLTAVALLLNGKPLAAVLVSPSSAELSAANPQTSFTVVNNTDVSIAVNAQLKPWAPSGLPDPANSWDFLNRKSVLIYPPIATLHPRHRQVFRLILRDKAFNSLALSRLIFDWDEVNNEKKHEQHLSLGIGYSIPVIVTPPDASYDIEYKFSRDSEASSLHLLNKGNLPVYVKRIRHSGGEEFELFSYLWPNVEKVFRLPNDSSLDIEAILLRTWGWEALKKNNSL